jgi:hypothetical protein
VCSIKAYATDALRDRTIILGSNGMREIGVVSQRYVVPISCAVQEIDVSNKRPLRNSNDAALFQNTVIQ